MCLLSNEVNALRHHHGVPPAATPALRAFTAAWLLHHHVLGVSTVVQAAALTNSPRPYVDAALTILKSEDDWLLICVLRGSLSLATAAAKVKARADLIASFRSAQPADRIAFAQAVGADTLFDDVVLPSL